MRHAFCTYFDRRYLPRGLALYRSLVAQSRAPIALWVLCLDDETHAALAELDLPGVRLVRGGDLEHADPQLAATRADRSLLEYYWTCTPSLPRYVLDQETELDVVTYLDSDLYFFGDPGAVLEELGNGSVLIVPHRFPSALEHQRVYGTFNVGLVSFRRDRDGLACLSWWRERCLEWCRDEVSGDRYGDQRYLDEFPRRFANVVQSRRPGIGTGPWNVGELRVEGAGPRVTVDGDPLVFYHFHGLRLIGRWLYDPGGYPGLRGALLERLYRPYLRALERARRDLRTQLATGVPLARWPWDARGSGLPLLAALVRRQVHVRPLSG